MSNAARQEDFHDGEDVAILPPEAPWDVAFIVGLLEQAGRGQNTAWALSNAAGGHLLTLCRLWSTIAESISPKTGSRSV